MITREKKILFTAALIVIIVYVATLWQRPMFAPQEFDFAMLSMSRSSKNFSTIINGLFGRALGFNIVSVRLLPALSAIICGLCVRNIGKKDIGESFGNIAAAVFLSTLLVFAYGTSCAREMINAVFLCTAMTAAFSAFVTDDESPKYLKYLYAAAAGAFSGCFALSMGLDALFFPFLAVSVYSVFFRPKNCKSIVVTMFCAAGVIILLWMLDHKIMLFSKYKVIKANDWLYLLAGTLPWGLFVPQAAMGIIKNKKRFLQKRSVRFSLAVLVSGVLVFPVGGVIPTAVMIFPFASLLFTAALLEAQDDEKALKISENTLKVFSLLLLFFTITVAVLCLIPRVPSRWKLYYNKAELAGFAVACTVALIQFKTAIDEKPYNKVKKLLHTATGAAVLMVLLPGAIPPSIKNIYTPDEFFIGTAARYMAPDTVIYADRNSFGAARWVFRKRKVILITKKSAANIARRIENKKSTAIFSTSKRFTKILPKNKMLFVRGRWRIVLCQ